MKWGEGEIAGRVSLYRMKSEGYIVRPPVAGEEGVWHLSRGWFTTIS